ncbi:hypothetical protein RI543_000281 [Arxiozyma heterogenica]|uniref:Arf-GAP domain-containing protein n=1 Tax=Arxiozyma heterogenica TaxID=278026 RepID=A0AAN7WKK8_9SACH|nr:hypothetical protein RI543_000281 [Kazachstania heterogenica]
MGSPQTQLQQLLKYQGNLRCADCKLQQHPRWASWSLGVFICIRCAGIHRSLGTHISKVKSVDLDSWVTENLSQFFINGSNERVNSLYFENKLTDEERATLDLSDSDILVQFIRNKYQAKKWVSDILLAPAQTTESILPIPEKSIYSQHEQQVTSEKQPTLATDTTVSPKLPVLHDNLTDMIRMNPLKPISNLNSKVKINSTNNKYLLNNRSQDGFVKRSIYKLYASSE